MQVAQTIALIIVVLRPVLLTVLRSVI